jgi:hypothetical protein
MTAEQMGALIECVRLHVAACPERYTQLVMRDMNARFPGLALNMGQIRKIKFRALSGKAPHAGGDNNAGG